MTKNYDGELIFAICTNELVSVLDVYGETYLKDCVETEIQALDYTHDVVDFRKAIRLAVAVAINKLSSDLRDCLCQDFPKKTTSDRLVKSISKINMLL